MPLRVSMAAIRHPRRCLALALGVTALAAPGLLRLELRTDGRALVPPHDPAVLADREVREHFGLRDPIFVVVESLRPEGIYNPTTLRIVRQLSRELAGLPGVGPSSVLSLATESSGRTHPGELRFRSFLDPLPSTAAEIARLKSEVAAVDILTGTLVSADGGATTVLAGVAPGVADSFDRVALYRRVRRLVAPMTGERDRIAVVGAPVAEALLGLHILEDLLTLLPFALGILALALLLFSRRLWFLVLAAGEVAACLVFTFGVMGWSGVPVFLTTAILPVILATVVIADEVHVFWRYQQIRRDGSGGPPHPRPIIAALEELSRPVTLTALTTGTGFLSFAASPTPAVRHFGLFAALGTFFSMGWSLAVIPASLALLGPRRVAPPPSRRPAATGSASFTRWNVRLPRLLFARRRALLCGLPVLAIALGLGSLRLAIQDSWIDGFAVRSPFRLATERTDSRFHGTHLLLAHLRFDAPSGREGSRPKDERPLASPHLLHAVGRFERFARGRPGVGGVLGPHSHLRAVASFLERRPGAARDLLARSGDIERALVAFELGRGKARRREVVDSELERCIVTVFLKHADYRRATGLMADLRSYARRHLEPLGARLEFAGDVAVSAAMVRAVVRSQISSVLLAPLASLIVVVVIHRSLRVALACVVPAILAIASVLGVMGWVGMSLGVATSMFSAIALGIAVDYAIHLLEPYRLLLASGAPNPLEAAFATSAPAIVVDCLAVGAGFGVLGVSQVPAIARLGVTVCLALLVSCAFTLLWLGSCLSSLRTSPPDPLPAAGTP